jgi:hypothetical protein
MMGPEFELLYFSRGAPYVAGGATTPRAKTHGPI